MCLTIYPYQTKINSLTLAICSHTLQYNYNDFYTFPLKTIFAVLIGKMKITQLFCRLHKITHIYKYKLSYIIYKLDKSEVAFLLSNGKICTGLGKMQGDSVFGMGILQ